ncbi:hypothetical protein SDC9_145303 [bioreactor metagenome]|uniref:Uncharacterized protein n=1 Tax=bioreactor metagenome TaxID=1076179 RepID=A0A645EBT3_9ZZZZ
MDGCRLHAVGLVGTCLPCCTGRCAHLRHALRVGRTQQRACLGQPRGGQLHVGVGSGGALDQCCQLRIRERTPPLAARLGLGRPGGGPRGLVVRRAECGWGRDARMRLDRRQRACAAREQQRHHQGREP